MLLLTTPGIGPPLGPVQLKVTFGVVELPDKTTEVCQQVSLSTAGLTAEIFGRFFCSVTVKLCCAVQPLFKLVTVTVYIPPLSTMGVDVLAPEKICPPVVDHK